MDQIIDSVFLIQSEVKPTSFFFFSLETVLDLNLIKLNGFCGYKGTRITVYACRHVCLFSINTYHVINKLLVNKY